MATEGLKIDARRSRILTILEREGEVRVSQLCRTFGASPVTIRSDLDALERSGYLDRVRGGGVRRDRMRPPLPTGTHLAEKQAIAAAAADLIRDGDTLFINSGTTTLEAALALKKRKNLNIVTNSVAVASALSGEAGFRVILLGGTLNAQYGFTCGGDAQEQIQKYQAHHAILSLDGVSREAGATTYHADEAMIDRLMALLAARTIIVTVHTKIGRAGFSRVCPLEKIDTVVTDAACAPENAQTLRDSGVNVILAQPHF